MTDLEWQVPPMREYRKHVQNEIKENAKHKFNPDDDDYDQPL